MKDATPRNAEQEIREQVKVLGAKFLNRTAEQISIFRQQLAQLSSGDAGALLPLQELAHKIHGSGAIFGFARISECAGNLERLSAEIAREIKEAARSAQAKDVERLTEGVEHLARALEAEPPPAP